MIRLFLKKFMLKAEIAIASRFRQIKQPIFFVIITPFLDLMVPTGFQLCLYCLHTSLYFWNLSPFVLLEKQFSRQTGMSEQ